MWFRQLAAPFKQSCSNAAAESCAAAPPTLFCVFVGAPMCVLRAYYGVHKDRIRMEKEKTRIISIFFFSLFFRGGDSSSSDFSSTQISLQENSRKKSRPFAASSLTLTSSSLTYVATTTTGFDPEKKEKEREREREKKSPSKTHTHTQTYR